MGKLIVIEGTDSSGKETQTSKLFHRLLEEGIECRKISFPNYESQASEPVKMYLAGKFGKEAGKVNPYPVSTMFAIDRYASYKQDWSKEYNLGKLIIADRYTTSNIVHQASKLDEKEKDNYINWLEDLEYNKMELPRPHMVIFLNMPTEKAFELMKNRNNKITGEEKKDIHEKDEEYLRSSYINACEISKKLNWTEVSCVDGDRIKTIEQIAEEIYAKVKEII